MSGTLSSFRAVCLAARPKTLPAAVVPVWAGCVLAWKLSGNFQLWIAVATLVGALAIQIATNFFNDAIDAKKGADTPSRLGPQRVTATGLMPPVHVMRWAMAFLVIASVCGMFLWWHRGWPVIAIGLPSLFLAYGYTGGPVPLAYRGLGELFVLVFFGFVAVGGTVFMQLGAWPLEAWLLGAQIGLLSAVLISVNNFRDREEDARTGKHTLAVRFGPKVAAGLIWLEIELAALLGLAWISFGLTPLAIASVPVLLIGLRVIWGVLTLPPGRATNRFLAMAGIQMILFAAIFHVAATYA